MTASPTKKPCASHSSPPDRHPQTPTPPPTATSQKLPVTSPRVGAPFLDWTLQSGQQPCPPQPDRPAHELRPVTTGTSWADPPGSTPTGARSSITRAVSCLKPAAQAPAYSITNLFSSAFTSRPEELNPFDSATTRGPPRREDRRSLAPTPPRAPERVWAKGEAGHNPAGLAWPVTAARVRRGRGRARWG